jgi:hypothetical protein
MVNVDTTERNVLDKFIFEHVCEELYKDRKYRNDLILNEGVLDFVKRASSYNPKQLIRLFDSKYKKLKNRVDAEKKTLDKYGINTVEIENVIKKEVKRHDTFIAKAAKESTSEGDRKSIVGQIVRSIKAAIEATVMLQIEKISNINPPDILIPLLIVVAFTALKLVLAGAMGTIVLEIFGLVGISVSKISNNVISVILVIILSTFFDKITRMIVIDKGKSKYYAIIKQAVEAPFYIYYISSISGSYLTGIILKIISYLIEKLNISLIKDSKKYGNTAGIVKITVAIDIAKNVMEAFLLGRWELIGTPMMRMG